MKRIRIYLPFTVNELKSQMAYRSAHFLFMVIGIFGVFISFFLWTAIYSSAPGPVLGGLSYNEMVTYIFMTYVTGFAAVSISEWVAQDVVKGSVAMQLIKPMDYRLSLVSRALGQMVYRFIFPSVFVWIGIEIYRYFAFGVGITPIENVLWYLLSCAMSFLIYVLFDFCVGMVAFFTTYVFGLYMVKEALMSFLTGQLIPLSFFPGVVRRVFEFLPFSSMVYTPVMVYLGKYSNAELAFVLIRQAAWVLLLYGIGSVVWNRVVKRLTVLGG